MQADRQTFDQVSLTMSRAELIALREAIAFADFAGDLPARSRGEVAAIGRFLQAVDPLLPELGGDNYDRVVTAAWDEIAPV